MTLKSARTTIFIAAIAIVVGAVFAWTSYRTDTPSVMGDCQPKHRDGRAISLVCP